MEIQTSVIRRELGPNTGPFQDDSNSNPQAPSREVFVSSGVNFGYFPVAGLTVGQTRSRLRTQLNLNRDGDARAVVNGQEVLSDDHVLAAGDVLTLIRKAGVKGAHLRNQGTL